MGEEDGLVTLGLTVLANDMASCTVPAIHADLRKLRLRANIGLVIVDFLQIVRGTGRVESRNNEVGGNSRGLKTGGEGVSMSVPRVVAVEARGTG